MSVKSVIWVIYWAGPLFALFLHAFLAVNGTGVFVHSLVLTNKTLTSPLTWISKGIGMDNFYDLPATKMKTLAYVDSWCTVASRCMFYVFNSCSSSALYFQSEQSFFLSSLFTYVVSFVWFPVFLDQGCFVISARLEIQCEYVLVYTLSWACFDLTMRPDYQASDMHALITWSGLERTERAAWPQPEKYNIKYCVG